MDKIDYPKVTLKDVAAIFAKVLRSYRGLVAILFASIVAVGIVELAAPLLYKEFFDVLATGTGTAEDTASALLRIIVYVLGLNAIIWAFYRIATFADNRFLTQSTAMLREMAFDHLIRHSYSFFTSNFTGSLVQRVNRFARAFDRLADKFIWNIIPLLIKIAGIGIVLFVFKPLIAFVMIGWALLFLVFNYAVSLWKLEYDIRTAASDSRTTGVLSDAITNHTSVHLFTGIPHEQRVFREATAAQAKTHRESLDLSAYVEAGQALLIFVIEFFVFYVAIRYFEDGLISIGFFVLMQAYIIGLGHRLWDFSRVIRDLYESYADAKEMIEIMALPHEIRDLRGAKELAVLCGEIEFRDVVFSFHRTREVLSSFNLKITAGEKVALVGPSGAGKSTITKLLLRLHDPADGKIYIDGQELKYATLDSLRRAIGLVPQDTVLFHRTLLENIRYGRESATDEEVMRAASLAHCDEFIRKLPQGYGTFVGERGVKLSGGERQRVAIARALLKNPPILILDEATSSLDSHSETLIQDALETLMRGKTVIVIAHRLSTIRKMDRIVVLEAGKIIEEGTHAALLKKNGLYAKLWKLQAGGFVGGGGSKDEDETDATPPPQEKANGKPRDPAGQPFASDRTEL